MSVTLKSVRRRRWLASLLVLAFTLRALIPAGFMPAGNGALALQICPEGFPVQLLGMGGSHAAHASHNHNHGDSSGTPTHDHKSWMLGHCSFGASASGPPLCHSTVLAVAPEVGTQPTYATPAPVIADFRFRIAQPRAPPSNLV